MNINTLQRQSLLTFGSLAGVTVLGYFSTIYFAHFLGPAILGSYFLFFAYFGIFDLLGDGGFGGAAVKRISEGKEQNEYFTAFIILRLFLLVFSISAFFLVSFFASQYLIGISDKQLFYLFIIALIVSTVHSCIGADVYGTTQVGVLQVTSFINSILKIIIQVIAVFLGFGVGGLVTGFIFGMLAAAIINHRFIRLKISVCTRSHIRGLLSFSVWTFLSSGGVLVFSYADTILIGYFLSEADVGIYRVAYQLASITSIVVTSFHVTLYPSISRWHAENNIPMIQQALSKAITFCFVLAVPITVGGTILAERLMYYLYGASFQSGWDVLIILLLVQVANIFMYLFTMCLNGINKPRESFTVTSISALLNIVCNVILIPIFGIAGAAGATLITISLNAVLGYVVLRPEIPLKLEMRSVAHILLSAIFMASIVICYTWYLGIGSFFNLCACVLIGAVCYFVVLLKLDTDISHHIYGILTTMKVAIDNET